MELEVSRQSSASPAEVWAVMTDIEGSQRTLSGVTAVERLDDGDGFGPGLRWRETRRIGGREASEEIEVTAVDEGRSYTAEAVSGGTRYRSTVSVEPSGSGSTLRMTFGAEVRGGRIRQLAARTMGRAFEGATRKALEQDLADIAAAAEGAGPASDATQGEG